MRHFLKETKNEFLKICSVKIIIIITICISLLCFFNVFSQKNISYTSNWRIEIEEEIRDTEKVLKDIEADVELRGDDEIIDIQKKQMKKLQFHLEQNISPQTTILGFLSVAVSSNFLLIVLAILVFARVICVEYLCNTDKIYISRNIKRTTMISAKLTAALLLMLALYLATIVLYLIFGLLFFGENGLGASTVFLNNNGDVEVGSYIPILINSFVIDFLKIILLSSFTALCAVISKRQLFAVLIPLIVWNFGGVIADFIPNSWAFVFFPNCLIALDYVGAESIIWFADKNLSVWASALVNTIFFVTITVFVFIKKPIKWD